MSFTAARPRRIFNAFPFVAISPATGYDSRPRAVQTIASGRAGYKGKFSRGTAPIAVGRSDIQSNSPDRDVRGIEVALMPVPHKGETVLAINPKALPEIKAQQPQ